MAVASATSPHVRRPGGGYLERPGGGSLAEVVDIILDKGLVIDAYVRVSLIGIEILTIDARIVIASVDTYLRFAEAVNRLDLEETGESQGLPELMDTVTSGGAKSKTEGAIEGVKEKLGMGDEDEEDREKAKPRRRSSSRSRSRKGDDE
jgi:gas vesicle structural protein